MHASNSVARFLSASHSYFEASSAARSGRVSSATRRAISEAIFRSNAFTVSWTRRYPSAIETV